MKIILLTTLSLLSIALSSCSESVASFSTEQPPENGAQFRKGEGLALTDEMKHAIGLQVVEVTDAKVAPSFTVTLHVTPASDFQRVALGQEKPANSEATGWLTSEQAALIKQGMKVEIRSDATDAAVNSGSVSRLEKAAYATLGEYEVAVATDKPLPEGIQVIATFRAPAGDDVASIPRSALLKTAEGTFAYTVNGKFYLRTAVKVGAMNEQAVEITDGLYAGDEIVASPVMSLWMAELQVLRGGKACTCGH